MDAVSIVNHQRHTELRKAGGVSRIPDIPDGAGGTNPRREGMPFQPFNVTTYW